MTVETAGAPEVLREEIEFYSDGAICRGFAYLPPARTGPSPAIVLAHGLSATTNLHYWRAAEAFARNGFVAVDFDPRGIGRSDGHPRQMLTVARGLADLRAAVAYARGRDDVDGSRVVLYGSSLGGGLAIEVASRDAGLAAVMLVVPSVDSLTNLPDTSARQKLALVRTALGDRLQAARGRERRYVRVFGAPGDADTLITTDGAGEVLLEETEPGGSWNGDRYESPRGVFENRLTAWEVLLSSTWRPGRKLKDVRPPVLLISGTRDRVTPPNPQVKFARAAGAELREVPYDHFGVFRAAGFREVLGYELDFLNRHVPLGSAHVHGAVSPV